MLPFVGEIEKLSLSPGSDIIDLAFDSLCELGNCSCGEMYSKGRDYGERPSDAPADDLLCRLAAAKRSASSFWDYTKDLTEFGIASKYLAEYGIKTYVPKTIRLMAA